TGFTTALTANVQYWMVFKNVNATPAINNCTFRNVAGFSTNPLSGGITTAQSWGTATSTNSGSTWSRNPNNVSLRVSYADSTYDGIPVSNTAVAAVGDG